MVASQNGGRHDKMDIVILLIKQNLIMLIYMLTGYFLFRKKLVGIQGSADIGRILLYVVMPVAIVRSYLTECSAEKLEGLIISFAAAILCLLLAIIVSRIAFRQEEGIERFGSAFSNAGFIGIPLVQMTLGEEAVFYVASYVAILNILQWTYGVMIITGDSHAVNLRKIGLNPVVLSVIAGMALFFLPISLPDKINSVIGTVASMNGPLAMIVLGGYLAQIPLLSIFTDKTSYRCAFVRLIVIPLFTVLLLMVFPQKYYIIKLTILIAASAPVGSNVAIFAQLYDKDYRAAVKEICLSTIFCIITLPLITGIANHAFL